MARRFIRSGLEFDDVVQAARLGLVEAAHRYDPACGAAFSTFAVCYMVGEIRRLVERSRAASGTRGAQQRLRRAAAAASRLARELGRAPTLAEVAAKTGCDPVELAAAIGAVADPLPYEAAQQGDRQPPAGPGDPMPPGTEPTGPGWDRLAVRLALRQLPPTMARLVYLRFYMGLAQQEAARQLGVSQPTVSRWEREALARLRRHLECGGRVEPLQRSRDLPEGLASDSAKRHSAGRPR
mgnify:CR=1 FL=1